MLLKRDPWIIWIGQLKVYNKRWNSRYIIPKYLNNQSQLTFIRYQIRWLFTHIQAAEIRKIWTKMPSQKLFIKLMIHQTIQRQGASMKWRCMIQISQMKHFVGCPLVHSLLKHQYPIEENQCNTQQHHLHILNEYLNLRSITLSSLITQLLLLINQQNRIQGSLHLSRKETS
jgi:hypothetical protein